MIKADLHIHTLNSHDGLLSLSYIKEFYSKLGYDLIAITDHDKLTIDEAIVYKNMLIIPGEEITTQCGMHIVGLFLKQEIKRGLPAEKVVEEVKKQNGLVTIPHPFRPKTGLFAVINSKKRLETLLKQADYIELLNYREFLRGFDEISALNSLRRFEDLININTDFIASTDSHSTSHIGKAFTVFEGTMTFDSCITPEYLKSRKVLMIHYKRDKLFRLLYKSVKKIYSASLVHFLSYESRQKVKRFFRRR